MNSKRLSIFALAAMSAFVLAGCTGNDGSNDGNDGSGGNGGSDGGSTGADAPACPTGGSGTDIVQAGSSTVLPIAEAFRRGGALADDVEGLV